MKPRADNRPTRPAPDQTAEAGLTDRGQPAAATPTDPRAGLTPICVNCRFYEPPRSTLIRGMCHESPATVAKLPEEWCGRWQPRGAIRDPVTGDC